MNLSVVPLHKNPEYIQDCCQLLNEEWKRSVSARLHSLTASCDTLPTSLILLLDKIMIGHAKLSKIPTIPKACFIESVVIAKDLRRKGLGTILMEKSEEYCKNCLHLEAVYLSTHDQQVFYSKLGYKECAPVSIYGGGTLNFMNNYNNLPAVKMKKHCNITGPVPPPLPKEQVGWITKQAKTFMMKWLT